MRRIAEKVVSLEEARMRIASWRAEGKGVVLAIGAFDPLEAADARDLAAAHPPGRRLVVGVASDEVVTKQLGAGRPVVPGEDRCRVVAALATVDLVVEASTPATLADSLDLGRDDVVMPEITRTPDLVSRIRTRLGRNRQSSP